MKYEVKPLPFTAAEAEGLSEQALLTHHDKLYVGYVNKRNALEELFPTLDLSAANPTYSAWRAAKLEETFAANGVILHEAYFEALAGQGGKPEGVLLEQIEKDFGSYERWVEEFMACGLSARGWVVLAWDMNDGRLHNYICDVHNQGGVWGAMPVLVLDVYEHAYFMDYGSDRKKYIEDFVSHINWEHISSQFENVKK